jgi:cellulose synthase/poly-beta-1,6-N-acetylglucosamine synthase-like glycosyltransferase
LDADVLVHDDTLGLLVRSFEEDSTVDAVFGSYDAHPTAPNFISNYKNLFHHYVHQVSRDRADTFWSGCGAVKRSVFDEVGGFDPKFDRPTVEDIELGIRLGRAGHRIVLNKEIQVTHAKFWGFLDMIRSDVCDRAIPWTRLIVRERSLPNDLNLNWAQRVSAALTCGLLVVFILSCIRYPLLLVIPALLLAVVLGVDHWSARGRIPTVVRWGGVVTMLAALSVAGLFLPEMALISLLLAVGIIALNFGFYAFFFRERNPLFGVAIFPLHLLYYVYSGGVFSAVAVWQLFRRGS